MSFGTLHRSHRHNINTNNINTCVAFLSVALTQFLHPTCARSPGVLVLRLCYLVEGADDFVEDFDAFDFVSRDGRLLEVLPEVGDGREHDADVVVRLVVQLLKAQLIALLNINTARDSPTSVLPRGEWRKWSAT